MWKFLIQDCSSGEVRKWSGRIFTGACFQYGCPGGPRVRMYVKYIYVICASLTQKDKKKTLKVTRKYTFIVNEKFVFFLKKTV